MKLLWVNLHKAAHSFISSFSSPQELSHARKVGVSGVVLPTQIFLLDKWFREERFKRKGQAHGRHMGLP
jgi:hypothetical protein